MRCDFRTCSEFNIMEIARAMSVIPQEPISLERPETNTLSVGAHPRDGESVEAKGTPKVK
jgi:hypothetical protein